MGIFYTLHMVERMNQRGITEDMLETVWKNGRQEEDEKGKITIYGVYEGRKIKIIAKNKGKHTILITSYFYD